jgi:SNF2 family DNA or RNA helicase
MSSELPIAEPVTSGEPTTPDAHATHAGVETFDLAVPVECFVTGWQTALGRAPKIDLLSLELPIAPPKSFAIGIASPPIKTFGFTFPEAPIAAQQAPAKPGLAPPSSCSGSRETSETGETPGSLTTSATTARRATRIKPPGDIIKLEDRLYYLLQPPLESLVASGEIRFPFEPFPYQYQGIAFLFPRYSAILADEMGLGKTMQAISTIRLLLRSGEVRRVLLICPKPLVTNWRREFNLWAPEIPLAIIEGDQHRRHWQWHNDATPVKLANYELLLRDRELFGEAGLRFDLVVLDEAQRIKNRGGSTSKAVCSIARSRSWALTGTPIENSPDDLVGIFEFLSPGYLSPAMKPRRMGVLAGDHILRRTKDAVLEDLPPKLVRDEELHLTPQQAESYQSAEEAGVIRLNELGAEITIHHVFELVLRLKQICNFDPATGASGKLEQLEAELEEVAASGQKAIVFSQWVETLTVLKRHLARFGPLEYHGRIPSRRRDEVIERFRGDRTKHVLLMSYGAGSVGLNLQFCSYVFLFDRWWNPAVEDQAINRAHRIGAAGTVFVTRMLTLDTIEERINQILEEKRELFATVFSHTAAPATFGLSQDEIFGLFKLRTPGGALRDAA